MVYHVPENKELLLTCPGSTKINFLTSTILAQRENTLAVTCKSNLLKLEGNSFVSLNLTYKC